MKWLHICHIGLTWREWVHISFQKHGLKVNFISLKTWFPHTSVAILGTVIYRHSRHSVICRLAPVTKNNPFYQLISVRCTYVCIKPPWLIWILRDLHIKFGRQFCKNLQLQPSPHPAAMSLLLSTGKQKYLGWRIKIGGCKYIVFQRSLWWVTSGNGRFLVCWSQQNAAAL